MDRTSPLNDRQKLVLRWIQDGCPDGVMEGHTHKTTARALQDRRLAVVSKNGGIWAAAITENGRYYLEHDGYPVDLKTRLTPVTLRSGALDEPVPDPGGAPAEPTSRRGVPAKTAGDLLLREVRDAGGTLRIDSPNDVTRARYRRAIHAAKQYNLVPPGHQLLHTGRAAGDLIIRLQGPNDDPDDTDWNRIRLNTRRITTDPGISLGALERDAEGFEVAPESRPRAVELVRLLAAEAPRVQMRIGVNTKTKHPRVFLLVHGVRRAVQIHEEYEDVPHVPTPEEARALRRRSYIYIRPTDRLPSGRFRLEIARSGYGRNSVWKDEKKRPLEKQVRQIFQDLQVHMAEDEAARLAAEERHRQWLIAEEQRKAEEHRQWRAAIDAATPQAQELRRRRIFRGALERWEAATRLRGFCDALDKGSAAQADTAAAENLRDWLIWARSAADDLDPVGNPEVLAALSPEAEPAADDLRPFIGEHRLDGPGRAYGSQDEKDRLAAIRRRAERWLQ